MSTHAGNMNIPSSIDRSILLSGGSLPKVKKSERIKESKTTSYAARSAFDWVLN